MTLDYSVSQEATLLLEEMEGMAGAVKKGIRPTQLYVTNMGGRLESHLREVKLEELFLELRKKMGEEKAMGNIIYLSESNGTKGMVSKAKTYEEKVVAATRYAHGQKTINEPSLRSYKESLRKNPFGTGRRRSVNQEPWSQEGCGRSFFLKRIVQNGWII